MSRSDTTTDRSGRIRSALTNTWNKLAEVESATTTSPDAAPTSGAIRSPTSVGLVNHDASFQLRIRPRPHSSVIVRPTRASVFFGSAPSELPSR